MTPPPTEKKAATELSYESFIASIQLYMIGLAEASCSIDRDEYWGTAEEKSISYKLTSKASSVEDDSFDARSTLTLTLSGDKSKKQFVKISVSFDLHFHADLTKKEYVDQFCKSEIRLIVWPYFREYVSNTIGRMHIPPVILPISNVEG
jgi:preprotein translocase subunit SecB